MLHWHSIGPVPKVENVIKRDVWPVPYTENVIKETVVRSKDCPSSGYVSKFAICGLFWVCPLSGNAAFFDILFPNGSFC